MSCKRFSGKGRFKLTKFAFDVFVYVLTSWATKTESKFAVFQKRSTHLPKKNKTRMSSSICASDETQRAERSTLSATDPPVCQPLETGDARFSTWHVGCVDSKRKMTSHTRQGKTKSSTNAHQESLSWMNTPNTQRHIHTHTHSLITFTLDWDLSAANLTSFTTDHRAGDPCPSCASRLGRLVSADWPELARSLQPHHADLENTCTCRKRQRKTRFRERFHNETYVFRGQRSGQVCSRPEQFAH